MCKSWCDLIIAIVVIVFALWGAVYAAFGRWILLIAGVVLLIHSFKCNKCYASSGKAMSPKPSRPSKGKKR